MTAARPITMTGGARARVSLAALCATLALSACGDVGETGDTEVPGEAGATPQEKEQTVSPGPSAAPGAGTPPARQAVTDLAGRLEIAEDEVSVESVEAVTWRDGSLGCAEKGTMYTQALVEGTRIVLRADGRTYEYHAGGQRAPFYCERPTQ